MQEEQQGVHWLSLVTNVVPSCNHLSDASGGVENTKNLDFLGENEEENNVTSLKLQVKKLCRLFDIKVPSDGREHKILTTRTLRGVQQFLLLQIMWCFNKSFLELSPVEFRREALRGNVDSQNNPNRLNNLSQSAENISRDPCENQLCT